MTPLDHLKAKIPAGQELPAQAPSRAQVDRQRLSAKMVNAVSLAAGADPLAEARRLARLNPIRLERRS